MEYAVELLDKNCCTAALRYLSGMGFVKASMTLSESFARRSFAQRVLPFMATMLAQNVFSCSNKAFLRSSVFGHEKQATRIHAVGELVKNCEGANGIIL